LLWWIPVVLAVSIIVATFVVAPSLMPPPPRNRPAPADPSRGPSAVSDTPSVSPRPEGNGVAYPRVRSSPDAAGNVGEAAPPERGDQPAAGAQRPRVKRPSASEPAEEPAPGANGGASVRWVR
jgi:hypothetical protein